MNHQEACNLLGVSIGASDSDVKSAFKKLVVQYHPDRNRSPEAEDKFKEINSAYQFLEKNGTNPPAFNNINFPFGNSHYNASDHLAEELRRQMNEVFNLSAGFRTVGPPIFVNIEISFAESVLGCQAEVSYTRISRCAACKDGTGKSTCPKCNGSGKRKYGVGSVRPEDARELPCTACIGSGFVLNNGQCGVCHGSFKKQANEKITIMIPAGTSNDTQLTLKGRGNYRENNLFDDLVVIISVRPDPGLTLSGTDVISTVELSLLEALKGAKKSLRTIKGEKILEFKPKMRNGERIRVSGFGVPPNGAHIFIVNVTYPDDVSKLINVLEPKPPENSAVSE